MPDSSETNPRTSITSSAQSPKLRWRIIPGTFLALFAALGTIGLTIQFSIIAYYNVKYGWIQVDPRTPRLSELAITPVHVLVWQCGTCGVLAAGISAYAWYYARRRLAWISTVAFFALMLTSQWLETL